MRNYLIFPALFCVLIAGSKDTNNIVGISFLLLIFTIRLLILKNSKMMILTLLMGLIFFVRSNQFNNEDSFEGSTIQKLIIFPDQIHIDGDSLSGQANSNNQKVVLLSNQEFR
jgi:hypothetical protein